MFYNIVVLTVTVSNPSPGGGDSAGLPFTVAEPFPILTAVTPDMACLDGPGVDITLTGAKFTGDSVANLGSTPLATTLVSVDTLTATIPASLLTLGAAAVTTVTVTNTAIGTDSAALPFALNGPVLTPGGGVAPTTLLANSMSQPVTLSGSCLVAGAVIVWNGTPLTATPGPGALTATVTSGLVAAPGEAVVSALNPSGASSDTRTVQILGLTLISPAEISAGSDATRIEVSGGGFVSGSGIRLGGGLIATAFISPTTLRTTVPSTSLATPGAIAVTVSNPDGVTSNSLNLVVTPGPQITSLTPEVGLAGDPSDLFVVLLGNNFFQGLEAFVGGARAPTTLSSDQRARVQIPAELRSNIGLLTVQLRAPGGAQSNVVSMQFVGPVVTRVRIELPGSPGPAQGVATAIIEGSGFPTRVEDVSVTVNGASATVMSSSFTKIIAAVAIADAQPGAAVAVTNFGLFSSPPVGAEVGAPAVTLSGLMPAEVTQGATGVQLLIRGEGFSPGSTVDFGGTVLAAMFNDPTTLTASIPPTLLGAAGAIPVAVINGQGQRSGERPLIVNPPIVVNPELPPAQGGDPYSTAVEVTGGTGDYTYLVPGELPTGLELDPLSGVLAGVPTTLGLFTFNVVVSDEGLAFSSAQLALLVEGRLVTPSRLSFELGDSSIFDEKSLTLGAGGSSPVNYRVESTGEFLSIEPGDASGTIAPGVTETVGVRASRGGRAPGVYRAELVVTEVVVSAASGVAQNSEANSIVSVSMTVNPSSPVLRPTQTGLTFIGALDGPSPATQTFGIGNRGRGSFDWQVESNTQGMGDWVRISPSSGTTRDRAAVPLVEVSVDPSRVILPAGLEDSSTLYAQLTVRSPQATNSPERLTVVFDLSGADGAPAPTVAPNGLVFRADTQPRTVVISNSSNTALDFNASLGETTRVGGAAVETPVFAIDIMAGAVGGLAAGSVDVTVTADLSGLEPGVYQSILTFEFPNATEPVEPQEVSLVALAPANAAALLLTRQQAACAALACGAGLPSAGAWNSGQTRLPVSCSCTGLG